MIERVIKVPRGTGPIVATCPFDGDPEKAWLIEIVDSNIGADGNPTVNFVRNGQASITFPTNRGQGMILTLMFYESHESKAVEQHEAAVKVARVIPPALIAFASKVFAYSQVFIKWMFWGVVGLVVAASILTAMSYKFNMTGVFDFWEEWNAARIAKSAKVVIDETIEDMSDEFYSLPGVKIIEEREGVKFSDLFVKVDEGVYLMEDVILNDGDPVLTTWGDLEDKCESLGGLIPTNSELSFFVTGKITESADTWANYPEWARDGAGTFSDDYAVYNKSDNPESLIDQGAYQKTEVWWADDGDALFAGRCIIYKTTFTN